MGSGWGKVEQLIHCFLPGVGLLIGLDSHMQFFFVPRGRYYTVIAVSWKLIMTEAESSGKVVLVCFGSRNHKVQFSDALPESLSYAALKEAICCTFEDVDSLKSSGSLILQV